MFLLLYSSAEVSVQPSTAAANVTLLAFSAVRRCCWAPAVQQSIAISCRPDPQQQTRAAAVDR